VKVICSHVRRSHARIMWRWWFVAVLDVIREDNDSGMMMMTGGRRDVAVASTLPRVVAVTERTNERTPRWRRGVPSPSRRYFCALRSFIERCARRLSRLVGCWAGRARANLCVVWGRRRRGRCHCCCSMTTSLPPQSVVAFLSLSSFHRPPGNAGKDVGGEVN